MMVLEGIYKCIGDAQQLQALDKCFKSVFYNENGNKAYDTSTSRLMEKLGKGENETRVDGLYMGHVVDDNVLTSYFRINEGREEEFCRIIEEAFPSIKVFYLSGNPNKEVCSTNDINREVFPIGYYLFVEMEAEWHHLDSVEEVAEEVSRVVGWNVAPNWKEIKETTEGYQEEEWMGLFIYKLD